MVLREREAGRDADRDGIRGEVRWKCSCVAHARKARMLCIDRWRGEALEKLYRLLHQQG